MSIFDDSIKGMPFSVSLFRDALIDTNGSVEFAKKILLSNKVQNFTAADVVALTRVIVDREAELHQRAQGDQDND